MVKKRSRFGKFLSVLGILLVIGGFVATLVFLYMKADDDKPKFKTDKPKVTDIVKKAVASGSIVPRHEVQIKARVSGIVRKIYVEPGDSVQAGDLIAEIKIVPDMATLTRTESSVRAARIALKHASAELKRAQALFDKGLTARRELSKYELDRDLAKAELAAAASQLRVVREGAARRSDETTSTKVRSTVAGVVLEVPVEEGASVIESNTFNDGTTIATVADMSDMIFLGQVDEADVDKIRAGMEVNIKIGAIDDKHFKGTLEYIAPKGNKKDGAIQFEIKAALNPGKDVVIRAGYSANAEIVLERREKVLAVSESLLQFDGEDVYVDIEVSPGKFERRDLELGVSDGINIEVKSGIDAETTIRQPQPDSNDDKA